MNERKLLTVIAVTSFILLATVKLTSSCNQMLCASVVSKCMLTQQCKCDVKTCSCCADCIQCLSWLWEECCSCVDLCPKPNETKNNPLSKQSHFESFDEPIPGLFSALLEDPDDEKWAVFTFPIDVDPQTISHSQRTYFQSADQQITDLKTLTVNCSVAYMSNCMSMTKCKDACSSMGANGYRWFFDGCCECVGSTCLHHGIDESRCIECPETKIGDGDNNSLDAMPPNEDDLDYGEDMKPI